MKIRTLALSLSIFALACSDEPATNNGTVSNNGTVTNNNGTTPKTNNKTTPKTNNKTNNGNTSSTTSTTGCVDMPVYSVDADGDGFAPSDSPSEVRCLTTAESAQLVVANTDCNDNDLTQFPGSAGICGDHVVDSCDGAAPIMDNGGLCQTDDEACPETQAGTIDEPTWDCTGDAPSNVYAFATFDNGNEYFTDGSCFVFFEGFKDGFYVKYKLDRVNPDCANTAQGCTCPVPDGRTSFDRRMHAFTTDPTANDCPEIRQRDHGCDEDLVQPASNQCRKYLDHLHHFESIFADNPSAPYDHPYSYVAGSVDALDARITHFKTLEIACIDNSVSFLNWATLMTGTIEKNPGFVKK